MDKVDDESLEILSALDDPSLHYRMRTEVLGEDPSAIPLVRLREQIPRSERVRTLLSERDRSGRIPWGPYAKWYGAHWVMADLAELAYPPGDLDLTPLREQVLGWLFGESHRRHIRVISGKTRRCAAQEGNALWALLRLGLADERCEVLARSLVSWQWPDGGWNCDSNVAASCSSFMETLIPMRALALFAKQTGASWAGNVARSAAEVFLQRRLFRRRRDGRVISPHFLKLHYPRYWHYDILFGLKVLAEMGLLGDERCQEGLNMLAAKRLSHGGWPAEDKYWSLAVRLDSEQADGSAAPAAVSSGKRKSNTSLIGWGPTGTMRANPWVTLETLAVLRNAGDINTGTAQES